MSELLFSYGTLQQEKTQLEIFGRKLAGTMDTLSSYKVVPIIITDPVFLAKGEAPLQKNLRATNEPADIVEGNVPELTKKELAIADSYEPVNYKRIKATLLSGKEAWIYVALQEDT